MWSGPGLVLRCGSRILRRRRIPVRPGVHERNRVFVGFNLSCCHCDSSQTGGQRGNQAQLSKIASAQACLVTLEFTKAAMSSVDIESSGLNNSDATLCCAMLPTVSFEKQLFAVQSSQIFPVAQKGLFRGSPKWLNLMPEKFAFEMVSRVYLLDHSLVTLQQARHGDGSRTGRAFFDRR